MRKVWPWLFGLLLLVWLLSALVVCTTPENEDPSSKAECLPLATHLTVPPQKSIHIVPSVVWLRQIVWLFAISHTLALALSPHLPHSDANGHVLNNSKYVNCVYEVFRPEIAGG